jgi:hypothetical protein
MGEANHKLVRWGWNDGIIPRKGGLPERMEEKA